MAAKVKKWVKKNEYFDFDGLELPENCNKPECHAHCWKADLIGYTFVIQKIALNATLIFQDFFCKISQKTSILPISPQGFLCLSS